MHCGPLYLAFQDATFARLYLQVATVIVISTGTNTAKIIKLCPEYQCHLPENANFTRWIFCHVTCYFVRICSLIYFIVFTML